MQAGKKVISAIIWYFLLFRWWHVPLNDQIIASFCRGNFSTSTQIFDIWILFIFQLHQQLILQFFPALAQLFCSCYTDCWVAFHKTFPPFFTKQPTFQRNISISNNLHRYYQCYRFRFSVAYFCTINSHWHLRAGFSVHFASHYST